MPPEIDKLLWANARLPVHLSNEERLACEQLVATYKNVQYAFYMGSRPQSLAGLTDSPVGLASFIIDFDPKGLAKLIAGVFEGREEGLTRDDVLDSITLFWLTNTAVSAARLYWENKFNYFSPKGVTIPAAVSVFPDELFQAPRSWTERAYPNLVHYNRLEKGGHFPAWEQPATFVTELRAGFESLR